MAQVLGKGYLVERFTDKETFETLYWQDDDGTVYRCDEHLKSNAFDKTGFIWRTVDAVPAGAEFIGNYSKPVVTI